MRVVDLPWLRSQTPVGAERDQRMKIIWVRETAMDIDIKEKIL